MKRILYVEPDDLNQRAIGRRVADLGASIECVTTTEAALDSMRLHPPAAVLVTWRRVDALAVLHLADQLQVPAKIFSGWPAERDLADRWISKTQPRALDAFVLSIVESW